MNSAAGDFHLQSLSPCINSGNNTYVVGTSDADGNSRIIAGTVDVGAYEFQSPVSSISYLWLQQHGLAINSSTDTTDSDSDGHNNWQEWRAGTLPNNPGSVLRIVSLDTNAFGLSLTWQSVTNRTYQLHRSATPDSAYSILQSSIPGQSSTTTYLDTSATNSGPFFYRVSVQ